MTKQKYVQPALDVVELKTEEACLRITSFNKTLSPLQIHDIDIIIGGTDDDGGADW